MKEFFNALIAYLLIVGSIYAFHQMVAFILIHSINDYKAKSSGKMKGILPIGNQDSNSHYNLSKE